MYYLHHVHQASASAQTVYLGNFLPSGPCLCRVLHTSLSFLGLPSSSSTSSSKNKPLSEILTLPINARIIRIASIAPDISGDSERLAVLTDHHQPRLIILRYRKPSNAIQRTAAQTADEDGWTPIETEAVLLLDEMGRPAAESGLQLQVEKGPGAAYLFSHTHAGILKLAPLSPSSSKKTSHNATVPEPATNAPFDLARAFGVRLPHPHLISSTFLARQSHSSPSTIALLSLSSVASRLPGLGMQCLPVLSFHSVDEMNLELKPVIWGPARKLHNSSSVAELSGSISSRRKSSTCHNDQAVNQEMPGSFRTTPSSQPAGASDATSQPQSSYHGPAAMGASRTPAQERAREESLAKEPLTRAHVPIPFADALGAHLLLSLPARAGGGVLLFSESCILHVEAPASIDEAGPPKSPLSPKASAGGVAGKRRKASTGSTAAAGAPIVASSSGGRRPSGSTAALSTSPVSPIATTSIHSTSRANENGKRRRSTASSQTQLRSPVNDAPISPSALRSNSGVPPWMTRILRLELQNPVLVASAIVVSEPGEVDDASLQVDANDECKGILQVLYGTHSGLLYLLTISLHRMDPDTGATGPWRPIEMSSSLLGSIPAPGGPNALAYIGESFVSIASTGGDSTVVKIEPISCTANASEKIPFYTLSTVHRWSNLAPILDFIVDDGAGGDPASGKSAQARIITCSGSGPTGSLRIVRNGVSLEDVLSIGEGQVRRIWSIFDSGMEETRLIVLGYHDSTRFLAFRSSSGAFEDVTEAFTREGLEAGAATLEVEPLCGDEFVLISPNGIAVWSSRSLKKISSWAPAAVDAAHLRTAPISTVAANKAGQVLVSIRTLLVLLQVQSNGLIVKLHERDVRSEVSALDISVLGVDIAAEYAAVALWTPCVVRLFKLATWEDVTPAALAAPQASLVRSILLHTFTSSGTPTSEPFLLLGFGDGTLNSFGLSLPSSDSLSKRIGLSEKRSASIGARPLHLRAFQTALHLGAVFVSCDRPTVLYSQGKGLQYSAVQHREVQDVCLFRFQAETMMIFAKPKELVISRMGQIQRLDVGTVELKTENPVSIALHPTSRTIAIVTTDFLPEGRSDAAVQGGKVVLLDYETFERLDEYQLELEERPNCIETVQVLGHRYLLIGTGYTFPDRNETLSGRLLLFGIAHQTRKLTLLVSHNVEGNAFAVEQVGKHVAACVNSKVLALDIEVEEERRGEVAKGPISPSSLRMLRVGEWACAFTAITLRAVGSSKLVVGDALRSLVLLKVDEESGKLEEAARDCDPYWTMAAEVLDEEGEEYIGCDIAFNLWTSARVQWTESAKRQIQQSRSRHLDTGMTAPERSEWQDPKWSHIMQRRGAYHYGDLINTMRRGSLTAKSNASTMGIESKVIFGTAAGAIGIIAQVEDRQAKVLSQLEMRLRDALTPVGHIPAEEWRTLRTDHRTQTSAGFIDGDFVHTGYDSLSLETRTRLLAEGPLPVEAEADEINSLIESLNRLS